MSDIFKNISLATTGDNAKDFENYRIELERRLRHYLKNIKLDIGSLIVGLATDRIVKTDSSGNLKSVSDLSDWVLGTSDQIIATDNLDGTVTLSLAQDIIDGLVVLPQDLGTDADVEFDSIKLGDLTASRMVSTDSNKKLVSISNLANWINGSTNQVSVTDNLNGTITISLPQSIDASADVEFDSLKLDDLTASRMLSANATKGITSIADLTNWIGGTSKQVNVTDDLDGTVTLSLPQSIDTDADVEFDSLKLGDLTTSRLVGTGANKELISITNLTDWIAGTLNRITVANDLDGTITISTPQRMDVNADVEFDSLKLNDLTASTLLNANAGKEIESVTGAGLATFILGLANHISVAGSDGKVLLSLPQAIDINADVIFDSLKLNDLTALRMTSTDANKKVISISDLTQWVKGTTNQVVSTNGMDGTVTLSLPQSINVNADVEFDSLKLNDLTASRILIGSASKGIASVADLTAWIGGTSKQVNVTDDLDGTITLSLPQSIDTDADVEFDSLKLGDLTASRLTGTGANKELVSITNLTDWIAGTGNQVIVTNDLDGTVTLSLPQSINKDADVEFDTLKLGDLTALRMLSVDATNTIVSIASLTAWIIGTTKQVTVTDNLNGTATLSLPQSIDTDADVEFDSATLGDLTALRILSCDANKKVVSITDLTQWIAGITNQIAVSGVDGKVLLELPQNIDKDADVEFDSIKLGDLTNGRLVSSDSNNILKSVTDLTYWINGTANQILVGDGTAGRVILSLPQSINTNADVTFDSLKLNDLVLGRLVGTGANKELLSTVISDWIAGTTNQITVTNDLDGTATLSLPQSINVNADVEFDSAKLNDLSASLLVKTDASKKLISVTGAELASHIAGWTNQVIVTGGDGGVLLTLPQDVDVNADVRFDSIKLNDLTPYRIASTDVDKKIVSTDATTWVKAIPGTQNVQVADLEGNGTCYVYAPQPIGTESSPVFAGATIGTATNNTTIEADGTIKFNGSATVWKDIDFPVVIRTTGTGIPSLQTLKGNITAPRWAVNDYYVCDGQELVHEWKEASEVSWHVHMITNGADGNIRYVKWEVEWTWCNPSGALQNIQTQSYEFAIPAVTPDRTMFVIPIYAWTPTSGVIGAHVFARLKRITSTGTAPTNNPFCSMLQLHVECDTIGSRTISAK